VLRSRIWLTEGKKTSQKPSTQAKRLTERREPRVRETLIKLSVFHRGSG
jgi:hypothetical protein